MAALTGLLAKEGIGGINSKRMAIYSYDQADAMLEARK